MENEITDNESILISPEGESVATDIYDNKHDYSGFSCTGCTFTGVDHREEEYTMLDRILANYDDEGDEFLIADGLDKAIIGLEEGSMRLIYSVSKCIEIFVEEQGMTYEEALEWFSFNVEGGYVGEKTPIWCHDEY